MKGAVTKPLFILLIIVIVAGVAFIGYILLGRSGAGPGKPTIHYGSDTCDECGMVIAHKKYAAAYYDPIKKQWLKFDDIGCMLKNLLKNNAKIEIIYVTDYKEEKLIDAFTAYYVVADPHEVWTPMSTGIVAFKSRSDAETFANEHNGSVYTWEELLDWYRTHKMEMSHHG